MSELAKRHQQLSEAARNLDHEDSAVEASPFIHEGGQFLAKRTEGVVPAEHVLDLVGRYEVRLDGLIDRVADQASEVNELTRTLELERRAAQGARHRLQVTQLEAKSQVDDVSHGAECAKLEATRKVDLAQMEVRYVRERLTAREQEVLALRARLEALEELKRTPWYAFKRRRALKERADRALLPEG